MAVRRIRWGLVLFFGCFLISRPLMAGCVSDCKDQYDSERESCTLMYDDPDEADDLQMCLQNAKDEYDQCVEECLS